MTIKKKGEILKPSPRADLGLIEHLSEQGTSFAIAYVESEREEDIVRSGLEFYDSADSILLLVPSELKRPTAQELLDSRATFTAMSAEGEMYCIDDSDVGVLPCPVPPGLTE